MGRNDREKDRRRVRDEELYSQTQRRSRTDTSVRQEPYKGRRKNKKRRKGKAAGIFIVLLILLVSLATIVFLVQDGRINLSEFAPVKKLMELTDFSGTKKTLSQAEELAQKYDYDGAITLLQQNEKFASDAELQNKAVEYENAKTSMKEAMDTALAEAEKLAQSYEFQAAADALKANPYYHYSGSLQEKAKEYEEAEKHKGDIDEAALAQADRLAAMYDYDAAIDMVKKMPAYQGNQTLQQKVSEYETAKASCVAINPEEVTHIFYHSLVVDPAKAFDPNKAGYEGWQQWMTTLYEFDKITQSMYDRGYVLVSLSDLYTKKTAEDGTVTIAPNPVYLPEGKKAFVMSLDDLSYYHTYDGYGVASKIVLDENGKLTCEYIEDDGSISYGPYDVVPRLNAFIEEHPDATYRNAKATVALTGYDGILGYRTDGSYSAEHNTNPERYYTDALQQAWLDKHPDFDWEKECEEAKKIANVMKEDGWEFASHTWGHKAVGHTSYEDLVADTERWLQYVAPLIGGTDTIIFAHGEDLSPTGAYDSSNEKYNYLKSKGFDIYCNVDSNVYTTTVTNEYFHQGRRNLDGYRIWQDYVSGSPMASDLFDAASVLDPERPTPVPDL